MVTSASYIAYGARYSTNFDDDPYDGFGGKYGYRKDAGGAWMYLCGARYYSPDEARFVNRDPISYAGGVNLYSYVGNNPMKGVDPSGLFGGGFPDPNDDSPSQDKYYTSSLTGRGTGIPAANKFFRFVSSFIPGVGQLLGFHEAVTGCDVTGTPVSNLDRVLGGLPAAGAAAGVLGGAGKALGKLLPAAQEAKSISTIDNIIAKNAKLGPLGEVEGAAKELQGIPVIKNGKSYDHVQELEDALRGLRERAKILERSSTEAGRAARQRALDHYEKVYDVLGRLLYPGDYLK